MPRTVGQAYTLHRNDKATEPEQKEGVLIFVLPCVIVTATVRSLSDEFFPCKGRATRATANKQA